MSGVGGASACVSMHNPGDSEGMLAPRKRVKNLDVLRTLTSREMFGTCLGLTHKLFMSTQRSLDVPSQILVNLSCSFFLREGSWSYLMLLVLF